MTAAYMRILINAVNNSLFPDADPDSVTWTGPPPNIVTVQSLLYASLATSLFAAFLAMLGKQWVNRYLRNRGGSAADKSRDRQRKLDGFKKWHFQLAIESLPVMLQFALLLLGGALSLYLWTISRSVAGVILTFTFFGLALYVFLTLATTFYYNCPYETPLTIIVRTIIEYLARGGTTFARSLQPPIAPFPSVINLRRILRNLRPGVRRALRSFRCIPVVPVETEHIPLADVVVTAACIFEDTSINWEVCKADARCVSWVLESTTDIDVIFSTVRFAADMIWYPEIVGAISPRILVDLFFDCISDGRVIPGKSEHASSIGMALASVLSTRFNMEPEDEDLRELCEHIYDDIRWVLSPEPLFMLVVTVLIFVLETSTRYRTVLPGEPPRSVPDYLSTTHKLWLSRIVLQTTWRREDRWKPTDCPNIMGKGLLFETLMAENDQSLSILRTNCFLTGAIYLGLKIGFRDLYAPDNTCVVSHSFP